MIRRLMAVVVVLCTLAGVLMAALVVPGTRAIAIGVPGPALEANRVPSSLSGSTLRQDVLFDAAPAQEPQGKRVAVSEDEIVRGPVDRPLVSLVINAGAGYAPADELLDVLASRGVHTTFFLLGWWVEGNPDLVRRIQAEGHEIASHGHSVLDLTSVSDAAVIADLERADAVISAVTGQSTRPLWSPSAGYRDARVRRIAAGLDYRPILWSQDSGDWTLDATPDGVRRRALAGAEPGAIIVFHLDSARSRSATLAVMGEVIDTLRARGLEPVTISELVGE